MVQLTMEMSNSQAKLDEKKRQHHALQFQMQDLALQDQSHLQPVAPPPWPGTTPTGAAALMPPPPYPGTEHSNDPLPDLRNLSLDDADWFHEGIPRYAYPILLNKD